MKLSFSATLLLTAASAWSQTAPNPWFYQPLGQVKDFLQLSDGQVQTILTNNDEYNRWAMEKQTRISQVQSEIAQETVKDPLDPSALGVRYAEVETICREMRDRANEYRTRNLDVLGQDQKAKMKVLEDAWKLYPVISQAQSGNLMATSGYAPLFFTSTSASTSTGVLGGTFGPVSGCYLPFPTAVARSGDFVGSASGPNGALVPASRALATAPQQPGNRISAKWFDTTAFRSPVAPPTATERNGRFSRTSSLGAGSDNDPTAKH